VSKHIRVPMPNKGAFVGVGDVAVSAQPFDSMRVGRRFNFDVSEEVLAKIGRYALEIAIQDMAHSVAHMYRAEVERAVFAFLTDKLNREWLEPIMRDISFEMFCRMIAEVNAEYYRTHPEDAPPHDSEPNP